MSILEEQGFKKSGKGKGSWTLLYGSITEDLMYNCENFINKEGTIGYSHIETQKGHHLYIFISPTENGSVITSSGVSDKVSELDDVIFYSVPPSKDAEEFYQTHLNAIKENSAIADKKFLKKQLKKNALPDRLYEIVKELGAQKFYRIKAEDSMGKRTQKYLSFLEADFKPVGSSKGNWIFSHKDNSSKVNYTNENFINKDNTVAYCKITRDDGFVFHVFLSKQEDKEVLTSTGVKDYSSKQEGVLLNSVEFHKSLEAHYKKHMESSGDRDYTPDKPYLEKELKGSYLANRLPREVKKSIIMTTGFARFWGSDKMDEILKEYLEKISQ